jgi:hypothetical protein
VGLWAGALGGDLVQGHQTTAVVWCPVDNTIHQFTHELVNDPSVEELNACIKKGDQTHAHVVSDLPSVPRLVVNNEQH